MSVFQDYANYYNALYQEKDYDSEASFVYEALRRYAPHTETILELGCGTGRHAECFACRGCALHGIDVSADMLSLANQRVAQLPADMAARLQFSEGDIRTTRLAQSFDAVISLFHVMSYQTTNADLRKTFATAKVHLQAEGLFFFDFWYGPAVLSEQPETRVKRFESEELSITRLAEPRLKSLENIVEVHYTVFITEKATGSVKQLQETHRMRYLFFPEMQQLCDDTGFELLEAREWMSGQLPSTASWGVYIIARCRES